MGVPPVYCDTHFSSRECEYNYKCDHNPPACTGGCCPPRGGPGSESLHVELSWWLLREQKYACGLDGSCALSPDGKGGRRADCQDACARPSEGRYTCVDGQCVHCGNTCSGVSQA